jgi:hypothetical protein
MKRPKTRFALKKPKMQGGGLMDFLNKPGAGGVTAGMGIGMGMDVLTGMIGNKTPEMPNQFSSYSTDALKSYQDTVAKNQKTKGMISGGLNAAGSAAMMIPGIGTAVGLGLKGLGAVAKVLPFGKKKEDKALADFNKMDMAGQRSDMAAAGARNRSMIGEYKAPAYGRKGMKFKSKYSKPC